MRRSTKWLALGGAFGAGASLATMYGLLVRRWHLRWGATDEEFSRPMPFDDLVRAPNYFATRAITIDASPTDVWTFLTDTTVLPFGAAVRAAKQNEWISLAPPEQQADASWVITLEEIEPGRTRLVSRNRAWFGPHVSAILRYLIVDPGHFVFERNWLLGLKARAEGRKAALLMHQPLPAGEPVPEKIEPVGKN